MTRQPTRAWVTGAGGFIASYIVRAAAVYAREMEVMGRSRLDFDLTDFAAVERAFGRDRPDLILHCAAVSRTSDCETDPARARRVNVEATGHLAALAEGIPLILLSSDMVFDGTKGSYSESDAVNPLSVYGETKVAAEQVVLNNPRHSAVRLSLTAGRSPAGGAFNEQLRNAWLQGRETSLFEDEYRCPLAADTTARAIWELAQQDRPGLYHLAGSERMSRLSIGECLAQRWPDVLPRIRRVSLRDQPGMRRPADTSMNCARLQALLSFPLPRFSQWLAEHPDEPV